MENKASKQSLILFLIQNEAQKPITIWCKLKKKVLVVVGQMDSLYYNHLKIK